MDFLKGGWARGLVSQNALYLYGFDSVFVDLLILSAWLLAVADAVQTGVI